jgi:hypothetical protein
MKVMHVKEEYRIKIGSENVSTSIQAYADDILLFNESKEKMDQILETIRILAEYANIRHNPKKCQAFYRREKMKAENFEPGTISIYGKELT